MKKILFSVLAIMFAYAVNAQVLLYDDFEGGFSAWTTQDADGDGYQWGLGNSSDRAHGGSGYATSASFINGVGELNPDNWLISAAPITIPESGYTMEWWVGATDNSDYAEHYSVYVASSNTVSALSATTPVHTETLASRNYAKKTVNLDAYAGQTVYIAFRHHSCTNMYWLTLDDVVVYKPSTNPEIALKKAAASPAQTLLNTAYQVTGTVMNSCSNALTSYTVTCTINGQTVDKNVTGVNVAFLGTHNFSVDMTGIANVGEYPITVTVSNPNGVADNTADNTLQTKVYVNDPANAVSRNILLENFTGAWCGYCPGGHQGIENALTSLGETDAAKVIWVAHHDGDALTVSTSETIEMTFPVSGFPSGMIDRTYWSAYPSIFDEGTPIYHPGSTSANLLRNALSAPAFVTVNFANVNYNATTRALSVTVNGRLTGLLGTNDARLNVWLMEDGLVADGGTGVGHGPSQTDYNNLYPNGYTHNHVLRQNLSNDAWGEAGVVTSGSYTKTYTTTVSTNYDASKCYLVAFVSNGDVSNTNDSRVFNSSQTDYLTNDQPHQGINDVNAMNVRLYPNPTTGNLYIDVEGLQKVEVIDAVGRVILTQTNGNSIDMSNLANGIYSVRVMANGKTTVKKVVKK